MKNLLLRLGVTVEGEDPMVVTIPTFRPDLNREIDLIEEVVRLHGFHHIAPRTAMHMPLTDNRNPAVDS